MGGCRVGLIAATLLLAFPLLAMSTAAAFSFPREAPAIRTPFPRAPVPFSGVVATGPPPAGAGPTGAPVVTRNYVVLPLLAEHRVTNTAGAQNEVSIAINPRDGNNIVASANDYRQGDAWCGVYSSSDGGRTWLEQLVPRSGALGVVTVSGDPSVAFDAGGNAYVSCLGFSRTLPDNVLAVSKSVDGGRTWGTPALVADTTPNVFHDKPYIAADASRGPARGHVYVTWTRYLSDSAGNYIESPIYFSRSTDGGFTWSPGRDITGPGFKSDQGSQPAVGPWSELYVSWVSYSGGSRVVVAKSTDGGQTWSPTIVVNPMADPGWLYPNGGPRTPHFPSIAVNPLNGTGGNRVHIVWADRRYGNADILMATSSNGGSSWGAPVRVDDDGSGRAQFFPWVGAAANGGVFVSFYDRRDDLGDRLLTVYVAMSHDLGGSFAWNLRVSAQFDPGSWFIGDYIGLAVFGAFPYPVWCDLRNNGDEEVYMAGPFVLSRDLIRPITP